MIWAYDDNGYLISADVPEDACCRMCGTKYKRKIHDRKPWQSDGPDACPKCGHVSGVIAGLAFENTVCLEGEAV